MARFRVRIPRQRRDWSANAGSDCETHRSHIKRSLGAPRSSIGCLTRGAQPRRPGRQAGFAKDIPHLTGTEISGSSRCVRSEAVSGQKPVHSVVRRSHVVSNQAGSAKDIPRLTATDVSGNWRARSPSRSREPETRGRDCSTPRSSLRHPGSCGRPAFGRSGLVF